MGKLIYFITTSLDGFVADKNGNFEWAMPSEEVHAFVNDIVRNVGTSLLGRNMYETMKIWDAIPTEGTSGPMDGPSEAMNDYAKIWRAAKKIVYSTSLSDVTIANATIERSFDPSTIQKLVAESDKDFDIGGPHLAAEAIKAGIVDEYHQIIVPQLIGSGNYWLPKDVKASLSWWICENLKMALCIFNIVRFEFCGDGVARWPSPAHPAPAGCADAWPSPNPPLGGSRRR